MYGFAWIQNVPNCKFMSEKDSDINKDVIKSMLTTVKFAILELVNLKYLQQLLWLNSEISFLLEMIVLNEFDKFICNVIDIKD